MHTMYLIIKHYFIREEKGYYDYEDETFHKNAITEDLHYLNSLIKKHTEDKKFIIHFKKLKTDLPKLYVVYNY